MIYFTLVDTLFVSEIVGLPDRTVSSQGRALEFVFVPGTTVSTFRLNTRQVYYLIIEGSIRWTTTRVVLGIVCLVDLAFVDTFFSSKIEVLPFCAIHIGGRAFK